MLLLKTEPDGYSFADLVRAKHARWDGVSNAAALLALRSARKGDEAWIYHTGDERAIVGLAVLTSDPYPDPSDPSLNARGEARLPVVDVAPLRALKVPITLARIKGDKRFAEFALVRQPRLSVMRVPDDLGSILREWAGF